MRTFRIRIDMIFLLGVLMFGCQPNQTTEELPPLSVEELEGVAKEHLAEELSSLGDPAMKSLTVRDTMWMSEYYGRELKIYERGLEDSDRRLNLAHRAKSDAEAILMDKPDDESALKNKAAAVKRIQRIEENIAIVDSLNQLVTKADGDFIKYYDLLASFDGTDENGSPINFLLQVQPDGTVVKSFRTRMKSKRKQ